MAGFQHINVYDSDMLLLLLSLLPSIRIAAAIFFLLPSASLYKTLFAGILVQTLYAYDNKGNVLTKQTQNSTASAFIKGEITYTADQNYAATQADARGKVVTSNIDPATSTLTSVQNPNGQTVNYAYDIMKCVTDVHTTADGKTYKNAYSYANDRERCCESRNSTGCNFRLKFRRLLYGQRTLDSDIGIHFHSYHT